MKKHNILSSVMLELNSDSWIYYKCPPRGSQRFNSWSVRQPSQPTSNQSRIKGRWCLYVTHGKREIKCPDNTFPSSKSGLPSLQSLEEGDCIFISLKCSLVHYCTAHCQSDGGRGHRAQSRAVIRESSNYRPAATTGGLE